ncbi:MAG TPA: MarR family transcriptional regulator [Hyphomicrobiaceae bacterium]|nr:MarR family transcriptional regulator [Hyphomicrobiaceae bacterium]
MRSPIPEQQQPADTAEAGEAAAPAAGRAAARAKRKGLALGVLEEHLGYFARRLQVWIFQDFVRTLSPFDIRPAQYSVLVVIEANPGLSQADLGERLGIERARLVRLLDGLEKRGLISRRPSPSDRRSHALHLTAQGRRDLGPIKALAAEHEARLAARLGPEKRAALLAALRDFA